MRKQTKIAAVASAAALLAIGASMTSFAGVWHEEKHDDGTPSDWYFWNNETDQETIDGWHTWNNDGKLYYIDPDTEVMLRNSLVEGNNNITYYVASDGARASSRWVSIENTEGDYLLDGECPEYFWYYIDAHSRVVKATSDKGWDLKKVPTSKGDKWFVFDTDGRMLTGWFHEDLVDTNGDKDSYTVHTYCYPYEDGGDYLYGEAVEGWYDLTLMDLDETMVEVTDDQVYVDEKTKLRHDLDEDFQMWMYFKNGQSISHGMAEILNEDEGKKRQYAFDDQGILVEQGWVNNKGHRNLSDSVYYAGESGAFKRGAGWLTIKEGDNDHVYYLLSTNKAYGKSTVDTGNVIVRYIDKKYYVFTSAGYVFNGYKSVVNNDTSANITTDSSATVAQLKDGITYYIDGGEVIKGEQFTVKRYDKYETVDEEYYGYALKNGQVLGWNWELDVDSDSSVVIVNDYVYQKFEDKQGNKLYVLALPTDGNKYLDVDFDEAIPVYTSRDGWAAKDKWKFAGQSGKIIVNSKGRIQTSANRKYEIDGEYVDTNSLGFVGTVQQ